MTWTKLDDGFHTNPKILGLSHQAFRLYVLALNWSVDQGTDGEVSEAAAATKLPLESNQARKKAIGELVDAGLWHEQGNGWEINDFAEYQPTSEKVKAKSKANRRNAEKGNHVRWHVERGETDPDCEWCHESITNPSRTDRDSRQPGERLGNRPEPEPEPDTRNSLSSLVNGNGGLQGGLPNDIPPDEWEIACQMAEHRRAEGYPVKNIGGFARRIWEQDKDQIRSAVARGTPTAPEIEKLLVLQTIPEDT